MDPGYWYDRREKSYVGYVQKGLLPDSCRCVFELSRVSGS